MRSRYALSDASLEPAVFWRITDNWLEMSLRFLVTARGVREVKDAISREILGRLDAADIGLVSATYSIVGLPPLRLDRPPGDLQHDRGVELGRCAAEDAERAVGLQHDRGDV